MFVLYCTATPPFSCKNSINDDDDDNNKPDSNNRMILITCYFVDYSLAAFVLV